MERCLILDFDDTLVSTIDTHADSWRRALERVLNRDIPIETIMADINYGMDVLLKKYQLTDNESKLAQDYKRDIFSKNLYKTKINQLLLWVIKNSNFEKVIMASNSSRENVDKIMTYHNISTDLFDLIVTRDNVLNKKPHSDMADLIFKTFPEYEPRDFLMVGDSEVDSTFALKNKMKCILVKF
jgi:phosphoglycolate phosphatase-like HAD superfamily hydrolase|tara:strand:- start:202 stop:753 length:552 start_codon:yes stop_codon:yes gene_type:complete